MIEPTRRLTITAAAAVLALTAAACGGSSSSSSSSSAAAGASSAPATSASAPAGSATAAATTGAAAAAVTAPTAAGKVKKIAFFGFWKSNSFTQGVFQGVKGAASPLGIQVADLSPAQYDGPAQIKAMQDETVRGDAQVYVVLATDPVGVATAAREAIAKGITVVAAFTPVGGKFDTLDPQVPGLYTVAETPVANGTVLGKLAAEACKTKNPCNVAYLEGLKTLPLDNARTNAFKAALAKEAPQAKLVADLEGGYTPQTGQKAAQDATQAHPEINVMVGSSQAILGAQNVVDTSKVALIGNGSSKEAFAAVTGGKWFAMYVTDVAGIGKTSADVGILAANGQSPPKSINSQLLHNPAGTKAVIADFTPVYSDLS